MKKFLLVITAIAVMLSLAACGSESLTTENLDKYLSISTTVTDCEVDSNSGSVFGLYYKNYTGDAMVRVDVVNQSGSKFENVDIKCKLYTFIDFDHQDPASGWEFCYGNNQILKGSTDSQNYKIIEIHLPHDGNWSSIEELKLAQYLDGCEYLTPPRKLSNCYLEIVSVSGTVSK